MSATETHRFLDFTLRPAGAIATDHVLAKQWTAADPAHRRTRWTFWLEQDFDRDSYLLLDAEGALFFWSGILQIKSEPGARPKRVIEMHIQFPPTPTDRMEQIILRRRLAHGLRSGLAWLIERLIDAKVEEAYFDSESETLITFCINHLGFHRDGYRLRLQLIPPTGEPLSTS